MIDFDKKIINSDKFRQAAIYFQSHDCYCPYPVGTTEYLKYWDRETKRSIEGYTAEDGDWISGYNYFYLNYCPILRLVEEEYTDRFGKIKTRRIRTREFPDFYDYDYYYYLAIQEAEETGNHIAVLKSRGKGFSFKGGSMLCRNYFLVPESRSIAVASEKEFLTKDGLLTKAWDFMDFIDANTAWAKKRQAVNTQIHRRASIIVTDELGNTKEIGYKSEILGITLKNNPDRIRGKRAKLILWEEAGMFQDILQAWQIARPSVEEDGSAFGLMVAFGCVCKGTRVCTNNGDFVNIEDLKIDDGVLGYDTYQAVPQDIENINPPARKQCVRITTRSGKILECSTDHPILWSTQHLTKRRKSTNDVQKMYKWCTAEKIKPDDQIAVIDEIPYFGNMRMWEPRLVGMLIGDGSYGLDKTPRLFNCDHEINEFVNSNYDTVLEKSYLTTDNKIYKESRIRGICKNLRELGIYGQTKTAKRLPLNIHKYDEYSLAELLGGLFDTDGYVGINNKRCTITLTQSNKDILLQVQEVLLHFGIHSTVREIKVSERTHKYKDKTIVDKHNHHRLEIADKTSLLKFSERILLLCKYKQDKLDLFKSHLQDVKSKMSKYISGIRFERVKRIESIGEQDIYNLTVSDNHNYICNGIVTHNTGGSEGSDFEGLRELFYSPAGYNVLGFSNIWDDGADGTQCGFFVPTWSNMSTLDENGRRKYMDNDGNSYKDMAIRYAMEERNVVLDNAKDSRAIDRYIAEHPINPIEACLEITGNIFPKKELMAQLAAIRTNKKLQNHKQIGDLNWDNGALQWVSKKTGDITKYPLGKNDDPTGSIVIWEHPKKDAPFGLYIGGCDPFLERVSGIWSRGHIENWAISVKIFQNTIIWN